MSVDMVGKKFIVEEMRSKSGEDHRYAESTVGKVVYIDWIQEDAVLLCNYEGSETILRTSFVNSFNHDWRSSGILTVETMNTVYVFKLIK